MKSLLSCMLGHEAHPQLPPALASRGKHIVWIYEWCKIWLNIKIRNMMFKI